MCGSLGAQQEAHRAKHEPQRRPRAIGGDLGSAEEPGEDGRAGRRDWI